MHTIRQAIDASIRALQNNLTLPILRAALVADGFAPEKAETIIGWAKQFIRKNKSNGNVQVTPMGRRGRSLSGS